MTGALVVRGDALRLPLADASVDLVVTSPPYWALRAYATDGHPDEIGSESHWREWLARMVAATAEMARVLKPSGSIFVNLGDKYANDSVPGGNPTMPAGGQTPYPMDGHKSAKQVRRFKAPHDGIPAKSLMLLPERYRIACVDQLGLTARAVIVWRKRNPIPDSARDRVRRTHEDWVHLTLGPRYYAATDELRENYSAEASQRRALYAAPPCWKGRRRRCRQVPRCQGT